MDTIINDVVYTEAEKQFIAEGNQQLQQEIFALPVTPTLVGTIDGMKLYSSDNLRDKYVKAMYKNAKAKPIADDIKRLVENRKVVPCWLNKGLLRLLIFKVFAPYSSQGTLGFFTPKHNKIFLLMDNNISFGFANDIRLANLMIHELCHMCSHQFRSTFITKFMPELSSYYKALFSYLLKIDKDITKESKAVARFLFKNFEHGSNFNEKTFAKYMNFLRTMFKEKSTLNENDYTETLNKYYRFIILYFTNIDRLIREMRNYQHVYNSLLVGYMEGLKVRNNTSFCVQELFYPSEIICIQSEYINPTKAYSLIKRL